MRILIFIIKPTNENVTLTNRTMYLPTAEISCNVEYDLFWKSTSTCLEIVIVPWLFLLMLWVDGSEWLWYFLMIFAGFLHVELLNEIPISSMQHLTSYSRKR